ncbi:hypothetical protein NKI25_35405 [Mesorhizobium sp. M0808]|uniref:hypothetical protein n=1 Tax=Mesorhizobium sp. M0808 TaxID=2957002 RepID=UPI00333B4BE4
MPAVTRRTLLAFTAVATVVEPTFAEDEGTSRELQALIASHETAYAALHRVVHRSGSNWHDRKMADRIEEQSLRAICSYPATSRGDRRVKAEYVLTVEARGELDLGKSTCRPSCAQRCGADRSQYPRGNQTARCRSAARPRSNVTTQTFCLGYRAEKKPEDASIPREGRLIGW